MVDAQIGKDAVVILRDREAKKQWEEIHRHLWKSCFNDPQHYEDFYFDKVYQRNVVYALSDKGMLHLNYYPCRVLGQEVKLPYIVGVATEKRYRHQGVMRRLLEQAMADMLEDGIPFTYLMPAKTEYYAPFGFRSVSYRNECEIDIPIDAKKEYCFLSYRDIKDGCEEEKVAIFEQIGHWLYERYDVYAVRDEEYYDLLYVEKICQGGDVIFCFYGEAYATQLCGVFAYAMDGEMPYVEQSIAFAEKGESFVDRLLQQYFVGYQKVKRVISYPYMLRVINRQGLAELFQEKLSALSNFSVREVITDAEMIEYLFTGKDNIYFAEIV